MSDQFDDRPSLPRRFEEINWANWKPTEEATILFVIRDERILLIRKKRGLGAGKINGPGGRLDPGETPLACAVREVREELEVIPTGNMRRHGELLFQFTDGYALQVYVFAADDCQGEPRETEEAIPLWTPLDCIPYDEMWSDDRLWLPLLLNGKQFKGRFLFQGDTMLGHEITAKGVTL